MRTRDAILSRMQEVHADLEKLGRHDVLTRSQTELRSALQDETGSLLSELETVERDARLDLVRQRSGDPSHVETGPFSAPQVMSRTNPWDSSGGDMRGRALGAIERCERLPDSAREAATRSLEGEEDRSSQAALARYTVALSNPAYFSAFSAWLNDNTGGPHGWSPAERNAYREVSELSRAMSLGTGPAGGFLVPYELDPQLTITNAGSVDPMRQVARVTQTVANEKRFNTTTGVTASWDAEAAEVSDDSPTLGQPTVTCHKGAAFVALSYELNEDSNIGASVGALFGDAKAQLESTAFTLGTGTGQPRGIVTALAAVPGSVIATGTNALAQSDLFTLQAAVPARWRPNARFMANLSIINGYRQLPQASGLNFSIVNDDGPVPRALGWSVVENSAMDGTLTATAVDYTVIAGDFQQFVILDRLGTTISPVPVMVGVNRRPTAETGFYLHFRSGADLLVPDSLRLLNHNG
jgi:HK97 family phage major capsid protein